MLTLLLFIAAAVKYLFFKMVMRGRTVSLHVMSAICHWFVISVNHDVDLSCIRWRASNRQVRPPVARPSQSAGIPAVTCRARMGK